MKKISLFTILLTLTQLAFGQKFLTKIDSLSTNSDVENLIHSFDKAYEKFSLKPISNFKSRYSENESCKKIADSLGITQSFYKADFDNNGYTDLLAIGEYYYDFYIFVIMNYG